MILTRKQRKFVEAYDGNATAAARFAGYSSPSSAGSLLLRNPKVKSAIEDREDRADAGSIANRADRQAFWTGVFQDTEEDMRSRLKASELLGKSQTDFVQKHEIEGSLDHILKNIPTAELERRSAELWARDPAGLAELLAMEPGLVAELRAIQPALLAAPDDTE